MNLQEEITSYLEIRNALPPIGDLAPYDWIDAPKVWPVEYMPYSLMLNEHAQEIANSVNQLGRLILSLEAWDRHLARKSTDDEKGELLVDFVDPLATVAINLPYVIRSRFIYSVAHLCHQANQAKVVGWKDDFSIDSEIYFAEADKHGAGWRVYGKLKLKLEKIAGKKYTEDTYEFRNKYNHRYSPKIEMGLTGLVTRQVSPDGQVSYRFGYTEPLRLKNVVSALKQQHSFCSTAYSAYQKLVAEQISAIRDA